MRVKTKLKLNSLVVLTLLVLNGVAAVFLIQRMMEDARQLVEVEEPLKEAILEMEINSLETSRAVLDYVRTQQERNIDRIHDSERDFGRYAKEFERLAETEQERELGRKVADLYQEFKTLGDEITSISKRRNDDLQVFRKDVLAIDELIDEKLQPRVGHRRTAKAQRLQLFQPGQFFQSRVGFGSSTNSQAKRDLWRGKNV